MKKQLSLEQRFHDFLMSSGTHEDVDRLEGLFDRPDGTQSKKPDYFLFERSLMLEKKTLVADPSEKINDYLNELANSDIYLHLIWKNEMSIEEILQKHPNSKSLREKIMDKSYKAFRDAMKDANKQLRKAAEFINFTSATKGTLLLNEKVSIFDHHALVHEIAVNLNRKKQDGSYELDATDFVILISETENEINNKNYLVHLIINQYCRSHAYIETAIKYSLLLDWSAYNCRPIRFEYPN